MVQGVTAGVGVLGMLVQGWGLVVFFLKGGHLGTLMICRDYKRMFGGRSQIQLIMRNSHWIRF